MSSGCPWTFDSIYGSLDSPDYEHKYGMIARDLQISPSVDEHLEKLKEMIAFVKSDLNGALQTPYLDCFVDRALPMYIRTLLGRSSFESVEALRVNSLFKVSALLIAKSVKLVRD